MMVTSPSFSIDIVSGSSPTPPIMSTPGVDFRHNVINQAARDQYMITYEASAFPILDIANLKDAAYDSGQRDPMQKCQDDTRSDVFKSIDTELGNPNPCICWLSGLAGTGKSSIAYSLSDSLAQQGKLIATFFFSQKRVERSRMDGFFPSIAHQIAVQFSSAKTAIEQTLEIDSSVLAKILRDQYKKLFVGPLLSLTAEERWTLPRVIVIDAVDECQDDWQVNQLILLLVDALQDSRLPPLKFFLTSRPEGRIQAIFSSSTVSPLTRQLMLSDFKANEDIYRYFVRFFADNRHLISLPSDIPTAWPSDHELAALVTKADGLFIYASTVTKFILNGNPRHNLTMLLNEENSSVTYDDLDQLYTRIISPPNAKYGLKLTKVIVHLMTPVSVQDLRRLLPWEQGDIEVALKAFSSVFFVPNSSNEHVRIYHMSFRDFLVSSERSKGHSVKPSDCHAEIATFCLDYLVKNLRRDICRIGDPSKLNDEVEDLESRRCQYINTTLRYCCRYWATHLSLTNISNQLQSSLNTFMGKSLLYWLETLSLLGELGTAISSLQTANAWYKMVSSNDNLSKLLYDAECFALQYFDGISQSALHVYYSALLFTPRQTLLRQTYADELSDAFVTISRGLEEHWSPCSRVITLNSDVKSIILSSNGSHCASASEEDGVNLWNTATGLNEATYSDKGQHACIVIFTRDGASIAAGSENGAIGVWNTTSGRPVINEKLHEGKIMSLAVSFSSDNIILASTSNDTTVYLWDISRGKVLWRLVGHGKSVGCVAFSPDDRYVVSAGEGLDIRLWNVKTGDLKLVMTGHKESINSVVFSPNGARVVSGSADQSARIWDSSTGECLMTLKGHGSAVTSVVFSPDSTQVISSSSDGAIRCWDASRRHPPVYIWHALTFVGRVLAEAKDVTWKIKLIRKLGLAKVVWFIYHTYVGRVDHKVGITFSVNTIPFAFDCYDLIFILDHLAPHYGPLAFMSPGNLTQLAISSDGSRIASSTHNKIQLWDSSRRYKTWEEFNTSFVGHVMSVLALSRNGKYLIIRSTSGYSLVGYTGRVLCVLDDLFATGYAPFLGQVRQRAVFSPDSSMLAYWHASGNKVRLYQVSTLSGRLIHTLISRSSGGRAHTVGSVAFSPDSTLVACGYEDGSIRVRHVKTGRTLVVLRGHRQQITSLSFSFDSSRIVSGSLDRRTRCWALLRNESVGVYDYEDEIAAGVFSPGSLDTVYAATSRSIFVWNVEACSVRIFASMEENVAALGFSHDGTRLFCRTTRSLTPSAVPISQAPATSVTYAWDFPFVVGSQPANFSQNNFCDFTRFSRYVLRDGWILDDKKRVCWVPVSCRPHTAEDFFGIEDGVVMLVVNTDRLLVLHFNRRSPSPANMHPAPQALA